MESLTQDHLEKVCGSEKEYRRCPWLQYGEKGFTCAIANPDIKELITKQPDGPMQIKRGHCDGRNGSI